MIARIWNGIASQGKADAYVSFLERKVFPELRKINGNRGAYILRRSVGENDEVGFLVLTLWDSMEAIRQFAGDDPSAAVVEDEAKALLVVFDDFVTHFEVVSSYAVK